MNARSTFVFHFFILFVFVGVIANTVATAV